MSKHLEEDLFMAGGLEDRSRGEPKKASKRKREIKLAPWPAPTEVTVQFKVSAEVYDRAFKVLAKRGTDFDTYLRLMVMKCRDNPILELSDAMQFGQFKGETIENIILCEPRYMEWLLRTKDDFALSQEAMDLLSEIMAL